MKKMKMNNMKISIATGQKLKMITQNRKIRLLHPLNWIIWPPVFIIKVAIIFWPVLKEIAQVRKEFVLWKD